MNRHFSQEGIHMANKHMNRFSASLIIKEPTMRYHFSSTGMAIVIKKENINCWWCGELEPLYNAGENVK